MSADVGSLCDTYAVTCIEGTDPPRGLLSLPSDAALRLRVGSFGVGAPIAGGGWHLGRRDFCRVLFPPELTARHDERESRPKQGDCFCPTRSMWPRANDTFGFGRRAPLGSLPRLPPVPQWNPTSAQCGGESYVVYACTAGLLLPTLPRRTLPFAAPHPFIPPPGRSPLSLPLASGKAVDVFIATSDHFGHGLFALVARVLNQVHLARKLGLEPYVHIGSFSFTEPQVSEPSALLSLLPTRA
jgi:hypothetical protein